MLRILFCITCCGAPPSRRPVRGKATVVKSNEKLVEEAHFKSLIHLGPEERDRLLENQIQANNESYGTKESNPQGKLTSANVELSSAAEKEKAEAKAKELENKRAEEYDDPERELASVLASTSVPKQQLVSTLDQQQQPQPDQQNQSQPAMGDIHNRQLPNLDDESISAASSIDIEAFRENAASSPAQSLDEREQEGEIDERGENLGSRGLRGPPLELASETAKTSPETTGAALTSASQDSLSDASLGSPPASRSATLGSTATTGAALVDNNERGYADDSTELTRSAPAPNSSAGKTDRLPLTERVGSPLSIVTTTSGGLTSATPTPSELSGGSQKKKSKLRPGALLKRLKPGNKKKSKDSVNKS